MFEIPSRISTKSPSISARISGPALLRRRSSHCVSIDAISSSASLSSGTNTVAVPGFPGKGKRATIDGMSFFRFADGKIVEEWSTYDNLSILKQLGLIPAK